MLMLSENATRAIGVLVQRTEAAESAGVRIATSTDSPSALTIAMAATPELGDEVVEDQGALVFVESDAVELVEDKVLDAQITDAGRVEFSLGKQ